MFSIIKFCSYVLDMIHSETWSGLCFVSFRTHRCLEFHGIRWSVTHMSNVCFDGSVQLRPSKADIQACDLNLQSGGILGIMSMNKSHKRHSGTTEDDLPPLLLQLLLDLTYLTYHASTLHTPCLTYSFMPTFSLNAYWAYASKASLLYQAIPTTLIPDAYLDPKAIPWLSNYSQTPVGYLMTDTRTWLWPQPWHASLLALLDVKKYIVMRKHSQLTTWLLKP